MEWFKKTVLSSVALLAVLGFFVALANLPAHTGCGFYAQCPGGVPLEAPWPAELEDDKEAA